MSYQAITLTSSPVVVVSSASTVDSALTNVVGDVVKVMSWYDNEMGYSQRLYDLARYVAERL